MLTLSRFQWFTFIRHQWYTITEFCKKPVVREKIVYVSTENKSTMAEEAPRLLNVPLSNQNLQFSETALKNKGISLKDDKMVVNLPRVF